MIRRRLHRPLLSEGVSRRVRPVRRRLSESVDRSPRRHLLLESATGKMMSPRRIRDRKPLFEAFGTETNNIVGKGRKIRTNRLNPIMRNINRDVRGIGNIRRIDNRAYAFAKTVLSETLGLSYDELGYIDNRKGSLYKRGVLVARASGDNFLVELKFTCVGPQGVNVPVKEINKDELGDYTIKTVIKVVGSRGRIRPTIIEKSVEDFMDGNFNTTELRVGDIRRELNMLKRRVASRGIGADEE